MSSTQNAQLIAALQDTRYAITQLLRLLQEDGPSVPSEDVKLAQLTQNAVRKLAAANGEWVIWNKLRPAFRDRDVWAEPLWQSLANHPDVQVRERPHGRTFQRSLRYDPLI